MVCYFWSKSIACLGREWEINLKKKKCEQHKWDERGWKGEECMKGWQWQECEARELESLQVVVCISSNMDYGLRDIASNDFLPNGIATNASLSKVLLRMTCGQMTLLWITFWKMALLKLTFCQVILFQRTFCQITLLCPLIRLLLLFKRYSYWLDASHSLKKVCITNSGTRIRKHLIVH